MAKTKVTKDEMIRLRVTVQQKRQLEAAARKAGLSLSSWMLTTSLRAAQAES